MQALVYHGPGERGWDTVPDPTIVDPTDIVVRVDTSTICGSDLHILRGDVPETPAGTVLGHEAVGTVTEVGAAVTTVTAGDRVLMSCISACGRCRYCKEARYGQCLGGGGWIFGHLIDGLQAEYARVPFADNSVYRVPDELSDEQVLFLADILPTAYEVGVLNGAVSPGDTVAIVGAGPVGLAAVLTAQLYTPGRIISIDLDAGRLERARHFGADTTIDNGSVDARAKIMELTDGLGVDVAIEAVGLPDTFELATSLIRPGGHVANVGVHGRSATIHLETLWTRDVTVTTGLVDTRTIPQLMRLVSEGRLDPSAFATHHFALADTMAAYDAFEDAASTNALKVVLTGPGKTDVATERATAGGGGLMAGTARADGIARPQVAIAGGDDTVMKEAVERELAWDPKVAAERVGVTANDGAIVLSGHVPAFSDRWAATRAAERVSGVRAVADEIEVQVAQGCLRDDSDIAEDVSRLLRLSTVIPAGVKAEVSEGHVTLRGECQWAYERAEAERALRFLAGVSRLSNTIMIRPRRPATANVDERVAESIERMADLDGRQIWVTASGGTVQLHGQVHSFAQRRIAEHVAAAAPGVADVKNELLVTRHQ